jgi:hypothetical protein
MTSCVISIPKRALVKCRQLGYNLSNYLIIRQGIMFGLTIDELSSVVGWIGGLLGSATAIYMLTANRRKVNSESKLNTSEAYEKMVSAYEKRVDKLLRRVEKLEERVLKLEGELDIKQSIIDGLQSQFKKLEITPET